MHKNIKHGGIIMGAILWGILGIFNYNLVSSIFGDGTIFTRILYSIVGISGVVLLATAKDEEFCECSERTHY